MPDSGSDAALVLVAARLLRVERAMLRGRSANFAGTPSTALTREDVDEALMDLHHVRELLRERA